MAVHPTRQQLLLVDDEEDANEELAELLEGEGSAVSRRRP